MNNVQSNLNNKLNTLSSMKPGQIMKLVDHPVSEYNGMHVICTDYSQYVSLETGATWDGRAGMLVKGKLIEPGTVITLTVG